MLSVIIPIYNEERYISRCLDSILQQDYQDDYELLLIDGMSRDKTRDIIRTYTERYPFIHLLDNPKRYTPYAMNIGIRASRGEIIMRLDAHATYETNYFSAITRRLIEYDAENVGCVWRTDVINKAPKTLAIIEVLGNRFGVGNSAFRTGIDRVREVDTVPFGCWPRRVFEKYGLYNERLIRNQDIELNKRIINGGGKIIIIPDTHCTYLARETYRALASNNYGNGRWNILTVLYTKQFRSLSLRHFIPLCFVLGLLIPLIVGIFWHPALWLTLLVLVLYLLLIGTVSAHLAITRHRNFIYLLLSFLTLHLSYGTGSLIELLRLPHRLLKQHLKK